MTRPATAAPIRWPKPGNWIPSCGCALILSPLAHGTRRRRTRCSRNATSRCRPPRRPISIRRPRRRSRCSTISTQRFQRRCRSSAPPRWVSKKLQISHRDHREHREKSNANHPPRPGGGGGRKKKKEKKKKKKPPPPGGGGGGGGVGPRNLGELCVLCG